jgi:hypothetical protein
VQLALDGFQYEETGPDHAPADPGDAPSPGDPLDLPAAEPARTPVATAEPPDQEPEPPEFDPDPFAEIPGFTPAAPVAGEYLLLPGSLRGKLDLREFSRFLATLQSIVKDWEGAPEVDDGGVRLRGAEGGAWVYPEGKRVRLAVDGTIQGAVGEDLVALCRWLEARSGMLLYPAGEAVAAGVDRSLDPWETFLGR